MFGWLKNRRNKQLPVVTPDLLLEVYDKCYWKAFDEYMGCGDRIIMAETRLVAVPNLVLTNAYSYMEQLHKDMNWYQYQIRLVKYYQGVSSSQGIYR